MSSISNILNQFPDFQHLSSLTPFGLKTQQFQAQAQTSTTSNFSFTTSEGDRVSLSRGSESQFSFESYNFQGLTEGQTIDFRSQQLSTSTRSDFSLLIEGDLNEQELADIQSFIQSSKNILQDVVAGNGENATEETLSLRELDSLSSASLFFQQTTSVSLAFRSTELAVQGNEQANNSGGKGPHNGRRHGQRIENILDKIHKAQDQFQIDPEKLGKRIPGLLSKLVETLSKSFSKDESSDSPFEEIRQELLPSLLQSLQKLTSEEETPEELAEGTNTSATEDSALPSAGQNGDILANLLNESIEG